MIDSVFTSILKNCQSNLRAVVSLGVLNGIPIPALSASLSYYDSFRSERLPTNLLQAQRDFFGAHGYERLDAEEGKLFHTENWPSLVE